MAEANDGLLEVEISKEDQDTIEEIKVESDEEDEDTKEGIKVESDEEDEDAKEEIKAESDEDEDNKEENGTGSKRRLRGVRGWRGGKARKNRGGIRRNRGIIKMIMQMDVKSLSKGLKPSFFSLSRNLPESELSEKTKKRSKKRLNELFTTEILCQQQDFLRTITKLFSEKGKCNF